MHNRFLITILLFAVLPIGVGLESCFAKKIDLDDGIEIDDSIDNYHELGKFQTNVTYIIMNAMSSAQRAAANSIEESYNNTSEDPSKNSSSNNYLDSFSSQSSESYTNSQKTGGSFSSINTITIGAGTVINGDVIVIDNSEGGHTAISQ